MSQCASLLVKNFPLTATVAEVEDVLQKACADLEEVVQIRVVTRKSQSANPFAIQHKGKAYVTFGSSALAQTALHKLANQHFQGQQWQVQMGLESGSKAKSSDSASGSSASDSSTPLSSSSAKAAQDRRRIARQQESLACIMAAMVPPPAVQSFDSCAPDLINYVKDHAPIQWSQVQDSCLPSTAGTLEQQARTAAAAADRAARPRMPLAEVPIGDDGMRFKRKRWQVESFAHVLQMLDCDSQSFRIVDFGCGTGNLLLPLASLFPLCHFTGVDMKPAALLILRQRAHAAGLANVDTFCGMIEQYAGGIDVVLALHACGNASDAAMLHAVAQSAAYVVSPCCVGKLKFSMEGGSSFHPVHKVHKLVMPALTERLHPSAAARRPQQQPGGQAQEAPQSVTQETRPGESSHAREMSCQAQDAPQNVTQETGQGDSSHAHEISNQAPETCTGGSTPARDVSEDVSTWTDLAWSAGCGEPQAEERTRDTQTDAGSRAAGWQQPPPPSISATGGRPTSLQEIADVHRQVACDSTGPQQSIPTAAAHPLSDVRHAPTHPRQEPGGDTDSEQPTLSACAPGFSQANERGSPSTCTAGPSQAGEHQGSPTSAPNPSQPGKQLTSAPEPSQPGEQRKSVPALGQGSDIIQAGAGPQLPVLQHPRSTWLRGSLPEPERHFKLIAQMADMNHNAAASDAAAALPTPDGSRTSGGGAAELARQCKLCIELDRNEAAREAGYRVGLFRVLHADQMAKGDLLVGLPPGCRAQWDAAADALGLLSPEPQPVMQKGGWVQRGAAANVLGLLNPEPQHLTQRT